MNDVPQPASADQGRRYESFVPLLLVVVAVAAWFGYQCVQLTDERDSLAQLKKQQEATLKNAHKMRTQLDAIASGVARLARQGNADAKLVVKGLRDRGIFLHAGGTDSTGPRR